MLSNTSTYSTIEELMIASKGIKISTKKLINARLKRNTANVIHSWIIITFLRRSISKNCVYVENYWKISFLNTLLKALEKLLVNWISDCLNLNNLLSDSQHGFRREIEIERERERKRTVEKTCSRLLKYIHRKLDQKLKNLM